MAVVEDGLLFPFSACKEKKRERLGRISPHSGSGGMPVEKKECTGLGCCGVTPADERVEVSQVCLEVWRG